MTELDRALDDITAMRRQMAQATLFRGYGPAALVATGLLAITAALAQSLWLPDPLTNVSAYFRLWAAVAVLSTIVIAIEAVRRSNQAHGGLADDMLWAAAERFSPAAVAGMVLTYVIEAHVPQAIWMLPGLWQIILSLGIAAACTSLPRPMIAISVWYLASGLVCLVYAGGANALSPLAMAIPFGVGQILAASLLRFCFGGIDEQE